MNPLLDVRDLTVAFQTVRGSARAVEEVSFSVHPDETLALIGETGCGKSMTASALLGLAPQGAQVSGQAHFLCQIDKHLFFIPAFRHRLDRLF